MKNIVLGVLLAIALSLTLTMAQTSTLAYAVGELDNSDTTVSEELESQQTESQGDLDESQVNQDEADSNDEMGVVESSSIEPDPDNTSSSYNDTASNEEIDEPSVEIVDSGTCGSDLSWELDSNGTLTIKGTGEMADYVQSPFTDLKSIINVFIEEGVTTIGSCAFYNCSNLTSLELPESITSIGGSAFCGCSSLTSIVIPDGVTSIGACTFEGCSSLTNIELSEGLKSIGDGTFSDCSNLTSITIPEGVTSIGGSAFSGCRSLTSITIPESVTLIDDAAFSGCRSLTSITIPEGVTSIRPNVFDNCRSLASITIPEGLKSIGDSAFSNCWNLTSITIPEGVTTIGSSAFLNCMGLASIVIPDGVTSIRDYTFSGCERLTNVMLPEGLESIGKEAFFCCGMKSIIIPSTVTTIGDRAFRECTYLRKAFILDGLTIMSNSSFDINKVTLYTIPESYASTLFTKVEYLCEQEQHSKYFGFNVDRIIIKPNETIWLEDYLFGENPSDCKVSISDEDAFFYNEGQIIALKEATATITVSNDDRSVTSQIVSVSNSVETTGLSFKEDNILIEKGDHILLTACISPENSTDNDITWTSSDTSIVTVTRGVIEAVGPGKATVTASLKSNPIVKAECNVEVSSSLKGIITTDEVEPYTIENGTTQKIRYYLYPLYSTGADLAFKSSNPEIISIDSNGYMTAHDSGEAIITISTGDYIKSVKVTSIIKVIGISFEQSLVRTSCGDVVELMPKLEPENATETDIIWTSDNESVASVNKNGKVNVHKQGIATIYARIGACSAEYKIVCNSHAWGEGIVTKAPTCTEDGTTTFTCICGESYEEVTPATGQHDFYDWFIVTPSTCEKSGIKEHACKNCGLIENDSIDPTGHDFEEEFTVDQEATCTTDGSQSKHCKNCDAVTESQAIPAHGHAYGDWKTKQEATCIHTGLKEKICSNCGDTVTEDIPLAAHAYGDWTTTKEPTVDEEGVREHTCSVCGDTKSEAIPKIPAQQAADEAITAAEATKETAEKAADAADRAQKDADEAAKTPGDAAIAAAEAAKTVAEAAKEAADAYKEAAEKADQLADKAIAQAETDEAKAAANTAKGKSSALVTGATAAVSNADTAVQTAIASVTSAENAKADAERAAQESARQAQEQAAAAALFASLGNAYEDPSLPRVNIKAPKKAKKAFTPKWKKLSKKNQKKVKGIEYEYSTDPTFSTGYVFRNAGKKSAGGKKIKGPSKTTYYVRAHTYVIRGGVKYVSPWSKIKAVKTK